VRLNTPNDLRALFWSVTGGHVRLGLWSQQFGLELGFVGCGFGDASGQGVQQVTHFSARGFEDEVLLVAMALLLDADDPCKNIPAGHNPEMYKRHMGCN
jgi:hypothetical protein